MKSTLKMMAKIQVRGNESERSSSSIACSALAIGRSIGLGAISKRGTVMVFRT